MVVVIPGALEDKKNLSEEEYYQKWNQTKAGNVYGFPMEVRSEKEIKKDVSKGFWGTAWADISSSAVFSLGRILVASEGEKDPNFKITEENVRGYEEYLNLLLYANNEKELSNYKAIVDDIRLKKRIVSEANGFWGISGKLASMFADPTVFAGGVVGSAGVAGIKTLGLATKGFAWANKAKNFAGKYIADVFGKDFAYTAGGSMLRTVGNYAATGAATGTAVVGIESLVGDIDKEDILKTITMFSIMSGGVGLFVGANKSKAMSLQRKKAIKLSDAVAKNNPNKIVLTDAEWKKAIDNPEFANTKIKSALGLEYLQTAPDVRGNLSPSNTTRSIMNALVDNPFSLINETTGEIVTVNPSIESIASSLVAENLYKLQTNINDGYTKYIKEKYGETNLAKLKTFKDLHIWAGGKDYEEFLEELSKESFNPGSSSSSAIRELANKNYNEIIKPLADYGMKHDLWGYKKTKDFELNQKKAELNKQNITLNKQKKAKEKELSLLEKPEPQVAAKDTVNEDVLSPKTSKAVEGFFDELDKSAKLLSDLKIKAQKTIKKIEKNNLKNIDEDLKVLDRDSNDHVFNEIRFIKEHTQKEELQLFLYNALKSNNDLREFIESVTLDGIPYYKPRPANTRFSFRYMPEEHGSDIKRFYKNTNVYLGSQGKEYIDKNVVLEGLRNAVKEIEEEEKLLVKRIELFKKTPQKATVKKLTQQGVAKPSQDFELKTKEIEAINKEIEKNNKELEETNKAIEENDKKVYTQEDFERLPEGERYFPRRFDAYKVSRDRVGAIDAIREGFWSVSKFRDLRNTSKKLDKKQKKALEKETKKINEAAEGAVSKILHEEDKGYVSNPRKTRGSEHQRNLNFSTEYVKEFLIQDPMNALRDYVRTVITDTELIKRFGTLDRNVLAKNIELSYEDLIKASVSENQRKALIRKREQDLEDLACVWCRVRGVKEYSAEDLTEWGRAFNHAANIANNLNVARLIGGTVISATTDLAQACMTVGFKNFFGGLKKWFNKDFREAFRGEEDIWIRAIDHFKNTRQLGFYNQMIDSGVLAATDNFTGKLADLGVKMSLITKWDELNKFVVGYVAQERILKIGEKLSKKIKLPVKDLEWLTTTGISEENAVKMFDQFSKYGRVTEGGILESSVGFWDDFKLKNMFRGSVKKLQNQAILTPTAGSVPRFFDEKGLKTVLQFKRFTFSAYSKCMIPTLQKRDLEAFTGLTMMMSIGVMKAYLRALKGGYAISMADAVKTSLKEAEVGSYFGDAYGLLSNFAGLNEKKNQTSQQFMRDMLGTGYGLVETAFSGVPGLAKIITGLGGEMNYGQIHNARKLIPLQNNILLSKLFDRFEESIIERRGTKRAKRILENKKEKR